MISKELEGLINDQINFELFSSYLYMGMSSYFKDINLNGFANWMDIQVKEETAHAIKFINYMHERNATVEYGAIEKPENGWDSPLAVFQSTYAHEGQVTSRINKLMDQALADSDHASASFLRWYVDEQVEEESNVNDIVQQLKLVKSSVDGLFYIDKELAKRVFVDPTLTVK